MRVVVSALAPGLLVLAACGNDDDGKEGAAGDALTYGHTVVLVGTATDLTADAALKGQLSEIDGCLGIDDTVVVWPRGTQVIRKDPLTLDVPEYGTFSIGDTVEIGGSVVAGPSRGRGADGVEVLGVSVPADCARHNIWGTH